MSHLEKLVVKRSLTKTKNYNINASGHGIVTVRVEEKMSSHNSPILVSCPIKSKCKKPKSIIFMLCRQTKGSMCMETKTAHTVQDSQ